MSAPRRPMTPEEREACRKRALAAWYAMPVARREAMQAKGRAAYYRRHPERRAVHEAFHAALASGEVVRPDCPACSRPMAALWRWGNDLGVVGWRCFRCSPRG